MFAMECAAAILQRSLLLDTYRIIKICLEGSSSSNNLDGFFLAEAVHFASQKLIDVDCKQKVSNVMIGLIQFWAFPYFALLAPAAG